MLLNFSVGVWWRGMGWGGVGGGRADRAVFAVSSALRPAKGVAKSVVSVNWCPTAERVFSPSCCS